MTLRIHLFKSIAQWLDRWQPPETALLGVTASLIGLVTAGGIWLFKRLIDLVQAIALTRLAPALAPLGTWSIALLPFLGGLVVGLILHWFVGVERHHGVAGVIEAVALAGGRLRYWRMPAKLVGAAISIGSGASVGPEDPSVQLGANLGSMFGQVFHLSDERMRALAAAGAAAGIAAAFNAPLAGIFFAIEIILGEISASAISTVVIAAVASSMLTQSIAGAQPAFAVPAYSMKSPWELPIYFGLGLLAGPLATVYIHLTYAAQDLFHALPFPRWLKPALAGLLVGVVGLGLPQALGVGYKSIEGVLNNAPFGLGLLLALLFAKLILTPLSIGGGFLGGVFAPALFVGAMLGAAYGGLMQRLLPGMGLISASYAMVGMAAMLAATVHAPLMAILLLFEMTNDYHILLPLMFAVVVSLSLSRWLQRHSIYTLALARKGIHIQHGRDIEVLETISVGEVMQTSPPVLNEDVTLEEAAEKFMQLRLHGLPVVNAQGNLVGMLTVQDLERAQSEGMDPHTPVSQVCTRQLVVTYPDETIGAALRCMSVRDIGRLPVVSRQNPRQMVGLLRRTDLIRAYDAALVRRAVLRHRAQQVRLGAISGVNVHEVVVEAGAPCSGRLISQTAWPRNAIIVTVRRRQQVIVPHGNTRLQAGDVLTVIADEAALGDLQRLCNGRTAHT